MDRVNGMRALALDLQNSHRAPSWPNILLLLAGLITTTYLANHSIKAFSEIDALEEQQSALQYRSGHSATSARSSTLSAERLQAEVKQANAVLDQLGLPWGPLFEDIESTPRDKVALLSIEPDCQKRIIKISGEAKDLGSMLGYIRGLQQKGSLAGVYLKSHRVQEQTAERPVHFVVMASWVIPS